MSERVYEGAATIRQLPQRGMITVRGTDIGAPDQGRCVTEGDTRVAWMSPDEILVLVPHSEVAAEVVRRQEALAGTHHLVQDVSDARAIFEVSGPAARETLAKLCPVDLRPAQFEEGRARRTRLAQVACAFWMTGPDAFELIVFASVADYAWNLLTNAAHPAAVVGHFGE